jgi:hypothetical protein
VLKEWRYCNSCSVLHACGLQKCYLFRYIYMVGRDSSVGIATRYCLDGPGIEFERGASFSAPVQAGPGLHPASYTTPTGSFSGVKRSGCAFSTHRHLARRLKRRATPLPPFCTITARYTYFVCISKCVFMCVRRRTVKA